MSLLLSSLELPPKRTPQDGRGRDFLERGEAEEPLACLRVDVRCDVLAPPILNNLRHSVSLAW
jgi:hypothetical protein